MSCKEEEEKKIEEECAGDEKKRKDMLERQAGVCMRAWEHSHRME